MIGLPIDYTWRIESIRLLLGLITFSSPEPPFLLVTWSEKRQRHFQTSSTGDENGLINAPIITQRSHSAFRH